MNFVEAVDLYVKALGSEGKSDQTIKSYVAALNKFNEWLDENSTKGGTPGDGVQNIGKNTLTTYVQFLKTSGSAPATMNQRIVTLRKFFEYLTLQGVTPTNPAADLKTVKVQRQNTTKWLEPGEVDRVMWACTAQNNAGEAKKARDKALVSVMVNCGLRVSEVSDLDLNADIDWVNGMLTIRDAKGTNGGKTRLVPMGKKTRAAIEAWLPFRKGTGTYVFTSERGDRMTDRAIEHVLEKLSKVSGVDCSPHTLRHTFGKRITDKFGIQVAAQLLGHEDINTTRIYATPNMRELSKAVEAVEYE